MKGEQAQGTTTKYEVWKTEIQGIVLVGAKFWTDLSVKISN